MKQTPSSNNNLPEKLLRIFEDENAPHYVVFEHLGKDGRIHRNFVTANDTDINKYLSEMKQGKRKSKMIKNMLRLSGSKSGTVLSGPQTNKHSDIASGIISPSEPGTG
mmetsp:Transcript_21758/g.33594  ORF Transcript_21758/g.33594 Transcript_21758/m.33594 type:complete len:108 (+) Transcript_21758:1186-1509(+)